MINKDYEKMYIEGLQMMVTAADTSEKSSAGYADKVTSPELKAMVADGSKIARKQADTIKELLSKAGDQPGLKPNKVMGGIIEAVKDSVEAVENPAARDAAIVATLQVALHYYIAAYGTLASTAKHLGPQEEARTIAEINQHMKQKDEEYTLLVESTINQ